MSTNKKNTEGSKSTKSLLFNTTRIVAPPGRLFLDCRSIPNIGICVEEVNPVSPLLNSIHSGDVILEVDGESTLQYSKITDFAAMIIEKTGSERIFTVAPASFAKAGLKDLSKKIRESKRKGEKEQQEIQNLSEEKKAKVDKNLIEASPTASSQRSKGSKQQEEEQEMRVTTGEEEAKVDDSEINVSVSQQNECKGKDSSIGEAQLREMRILKKEHGAKVDDVEIKVSSIASNTRDKVSGKNKSKNQKEGDVEVFSKNHSSHTCSIEYQNEVKHAEVGERLIPFVMESTLKSSLVSTKRGGLDASQNIKKKLKTAPMQAAESKKVGGNKFGYEKDTVVEQGRPKIEGKIANNSIVTPPLQGGDQSILKIKQKKPLKEKVSIQIQSKKLNHVQDQIQNIAGNNVARPHYFLQALKVQQCVFRRSPSSSTNISSFAGTNFYSYEYAVHQNLHTRNGNFLKNQICLAGKSMTHSIGRQPLQGHIQQIARNPSMPRLPPHNQFQQYPQNSYPGLGLNNSIPNNHLSNPSNNADINVKLSSVVQDVRRNAHLVINSTSLKMSPQLQHMKYLEKQSVSQNLVNDSSTQKLSSRLAYVRKPSVSKAHINDSSLQKPQQVIENRENVITSQIQGKTSFAQKRSHMMENRYTINVSQKPANISSLTQVEDNRESQIASQNLVNGSSIPKSSKFTESRTQNPANGSFIQTQTQVIKSRKSENTSHNLANGSSIQTVSQAMKGTTNSISQSPANDSSIQNISQPSSTTNDELGPESTTTTNSCTVISLSGLSPSIFTENDLSQMPVWFSFNHEDRKSQNGQKEIVERETGKSLKDIKSNEFFPSAEFPDGWTVQYVKRLNNLNRVDRYWYSPKLKKKFRSKVSVRVFLDFLGEVGGDEAKAFLLAKKHMR